jgi:hypothetical protein
MPQPRFPGGAVALLALLALLAALAVERTTEPLAAADAAEENAMTRTQKLPALDRAEHGPLRTATFALG